MKYKEINSFKTQYEKYHYYNSLRNEYIIFSEKVLLLNCECNYDPSNIHILFLFYNIDDNYGYSRLYTWGFVLPEIIPVILATYKRKKDDHACSRCNEKRWKMNSNLFYQKIYMCQNGHLDNSNKDEFESDY